VLGGRCSALDGLLAGRGFTTPLTHLPATVRELAAGGYDIAHAFSPQDAYAALRWRRRSGRPLVFSLAEPVAREHIADRRLRLRFLLAALTQSDAVIVHDEETRAAAWRWLALEPPVIELDDGAGHERLYLGLLAHRSD
jgi:hypothetical protein